VTAAGVERPLGVRVRGRVDAVLLELLVTDQPVDEVAAEPVGAGGGEDHAGDSFDDGDGEAGAAQVVKPQRGVVGSRS
jgi:hypothetical protein